MKEKEVSTQAKIIREVLAYFSGTNLIGKSIRNGQLRKLIAEPTWKCPEHLFHARIKLKNCYGEMLTALEPNESMVLYQLHGGGYVGGMTNTYRSFAGLYSELGHGMSVFTLDYRLAPEYPFPAALEDALDGFEWLQSMGWRPDQIILAGDSAGGGLAIALCMYLRDRGEKMPAGIIAMSPWTDMTSSGSSYTENFDKDPIFGNTFDSLVYNRDYVQIADPTNPYISPAFGDFAGFPPMLIQVGQDEMILSDSVEVARKAKKEKVKVRLHVYKGMFHVFQMALLALPESKEAWEEVGQFIDILLNRQRKQKKVTGEVNERMYDLS